VQEGGGDPGQALRQGAGVLAPADGRAFGRVDLAGVHAADHPLNAHPGLLEPSEYRALDRRGAPQ
jgi:hypothetical protein